LLMWQLSYYKLLRDSTSPVVKESLKLKIGDVRLEN
jgi:hypothetical protein